MSLVDVVMPKMGESITDATIIKWYKKEGEKISEEETLLEVATDKVDSEIPSPVQGIVVEILHNQDEVVEVGEVIAKIETGEGGVTKVNKPKEESKKKKEAKTEEVKTEKASPVKAQPQKAYDHTISGGDESRFYSPLVRSIAAEEGISKEELDRIEGSGAKGRVTKKDILQYIQKGGIKSTTTPEYVSQEATSTIVDKPQTESSESTTQETTKTQQNIEIIEMGRMRKLIADHMVNSKKTSAHVTSFAEADVTALFNWRNKVKDQFFKKYGQKLTFTPLFVEIVAKAIQEHPRLNVSVQEDKILLKKDINIGIATALPDGNLIVPVIKNADMYNLLGIAKTMNDMVERARVGQLDPADIQGGTFTLTNIGTYGNILGTPIINQPQVAILATGAIKKKPVVIESTEGDSIGIRQMMYLSLSYDHRVVDGYMGGTFLQKIVKYLESFDDTRQI